VSRFKKTTNKQLGELLIERGVINRDQLDTVIEEQKKVGGLIGELLVSMNFATEKDIAQALTCQYGFPYLPLGNYEVDQEVLSSLSKDICKKYILVPIDKIGKSLTLAMANPLNISAIEEVEQSSGCAVQVFVSTSTEIKQFIEKFYKQ
jgi:type IV pilus assembly protein PilB